MNDKLLYSFTDNFSTLSSTFSYKEGSETVTLRIEKCLDDLDVQEKIKSKTQFIEENVEILKYIRNKLNG